MPQLNARYCKTATPNPAKATKLHDGGGLYLLIKPSGRKSWILRYQLAGRRTEMGLGSYPAISLARARELALEAKGHLAEGRDPIRIRQRAQQRKVDTFEQAARTYLAMKAQEWTSPAHARNWLAMMTSHAFPLIGQIKVNDIDKQDIIRVIEPIWQSKGPTASRLRSHIANVLDNAKGRGQRSGDNPAEWKGNLDALLPSAAKIRNISHHEAADWRELPGIWADLSEKSGPNFACLRLIILTAVRLTEARGAFWRELHPDRAIWNIPAARMKMKRPHVVPMSDAALAVLDDHARYVGRRDDDLIFPGRNGTAVAPGSVRNALKAIGRGELTVHGFRSSFRDWTGENDVAHREVAEMALAHRIMNDSEAAYARGTLLERRRHLMSVWAGYVTGQASANVVQLAG